MKKRISGIILAGGVNSRFRGKTKSKIVIDGKPIISRIISTIKDLFDEIIIVTNSPEEFEDYNNYKIVKDKFLMVGPLGGIHAALKVSSGEAMFVFAGDMPFLDKKIILEQIELFNNCQCDVFIPRVNKNIEPLHAIYSISIINTLEEYLSGDNNKAVREYLRKINVRYFEVDESTAAAKAFTNINTPKDLSLLSK
jgi:molybdenum cofactor guanylyltransferase